MKWVISNPSIYADFLSKELEIFPLTAQVIVNRGIKNPDLAKDFLSCRISSLHLPNSLLDVEKAGERIKKAISKKEKVLVYGDYDVDGISATALLVKFFRQLGLNPDWYIPDRLDEGYGISKQSLNKLSCYSLVITVDCGIGAKQQVQFLQSLGVDVIVTDHHCIPEYGVPSAFACINPHQPNCQYPDNNLAGVGVAFKLAQVLEQNRVLEDFFDIVSIGTVADVAPLIGENRIFVRHGLNRLQYTTNYGLRALIGTTGLTGKTLCSNHIAFILGPRINAVGRLGDAEHAMHLLIAEDRGSASKFAELLEDANKKRKKIEEQILNEAQIKIQEEMDLKNDRALIIEGKEWSSGIIGLIASRLVDIYSRPCIVISSTGESVWKGSGRSIERFNLVEALNKCSDILEKYGGHSSAAGLTIRNDNIHTFRQRLNKIASEILTLDDLCKKIHIDAQVDLKDITPELIEEMRALEPYGEGNPQPVFISKNLNLKSFSYNTTNGRTIAWLTDGNVTYQGTIRKKMQGAVGAISKTTGIDAVFSPSLTFIEGSPSIKLDIVDLKISQMK